MKAKIWIAVICLLTLVLKLGGIIDKEVYWFIYAIGIISGYVIYGLVWTIRQNYKIYNDVPNMLRIALATVGCIIIVSRENPTIYALGVLLIILGILLNDEWQRKKFHEILNLIKPDRKQ